MSVFHVSTPPWAMAETADRCRLLLAAPCGEVRTATVRYADPYDYLPGDSKAHALADIPMRPLPCAQGMDWFVAEGVPMPTHKLSYHFALTLDGDACALLGANGLLDMAEEARLEPFLMAYRFASQTPNPPVWAGSTVWYQIFPDRFSAQSPACAPEMFVPRREGFFGGTLAGITERLPWLQALGVTGVYLNPVFASPSNHRYDTVDYRAVDARLGSKADLVALADALHTGGMRLMLDGVFNHASDRCPQFVDVVANGRQSPYWDWFLIRDEAALRNESPELWTSQRMKTNPPYECFAFAANMPKWNTDHPAVIDYVTGAAAGWTRDLALDAWRLDVPDEISPRFLRAFRERVRAVNPQAEVIGEIWGEPWPWLMGDMFDGVMDYPVYFALRDFLLRKTIGAHLFCDRMNVLGNRMPPAQARRCMRFLGNHDLPRAITEAGGSADAVRAALLVLLLALPGELCLYYGDEVDLAGGADPANRGAMLFAGEGAQGDTFRLIAEAIAARAKLGAVGPDEVYWAAPDDWRAQVHCRYGQRTLTLTLHPAGLCGTGRVTAEAVRQLLATGFTQAG